MCRLSSTDGVIHLCENSLLRYQTTSSQEVDLQSVACVRNEQLRERGSSVIHNSTRPPSQISWCFYTVQQIYEQINITVHQIQWVKKQIVVSWLPCTVDAPWACCAAVTLRKPQPAGECAAGGHWVDVRWNLHFSQKSWPSTSRTQSQQGRRLDCQVLVSASATWCRQRLTVNSS